MWACNVPVQLAIGRSPTLWDGGAEGFGEALLGNETGRRSGNFVAPPCRFGLDLSLFRHNRAVTRMRALNTETDLSTANADSVASPLQSPVGSTDVLP